MSTSWGPSLGHPDRAAGRPPTGLDGVPYRRHAAARQDLGAADPGAAPRRPGALPDVVARHRPDRCRGPRHPGHRQCHYRLAAAAIGRPAFPRTSGAELVTADSRNGYQRGTRRLEVRVRLACARRGCRHRTRTRRPPTRCRGRDQPRRSIAASSGGCPTFPASDELPSAAPEGMEGEFDDRIDPRFPVFSATGLADALPGPLTPITLDVQLSGLRTASRATGQVLALGGVVADEWGSRAIAVFGHRPYVGVSANAVAAAQLPGWDEKALVAAPWSTSPRSVTCCRLVSPGWPKDLSDRSPKRSSRRDPWPIAPSQSRYPGLRRRGPGRTLRYR